MKTAFADPLEQSEGDPCESCRLFWEHQGLPPMTLTYLRDAVGEVITTTDKQIPILICPRCDGTMILELNGR